MCLISGIGGEKPHANYTAILRLGSSAEAELDRRGPGEERTDDAVYQVAHDIAREGDLPLRWEGSYHIWAPDQIDIAAESLLRLRERYSHGKLQFNTIKIHYDGMQDILTAGMLEPYVTDPDNYGGVLFTPQRLSGIVTLSALISIW